MQKLFSKAKVLIVTGFDKDLIYFIPTIKLLKEYGWKYKKSYISITFCFLIWYIDIHFNYMVDEIA